MVEEDPDSKVRGANMSITIGGSNSTVNSLRQSDAYMRQ